MKAWMPVKKAASCRLFEGPGLGRLAAICTSAGEPTAMNAPQPVRQSLSVSQRAALLRAGGGTHLALQRAGKGGSGRGFCPPQWAAAA